MGAGQFVQGQVTQAVVTAGGHAGRRGIFFACDAGDRTQNLIYAEQLFFY